MNPPCTISQSVSSLLLYSFCHVMLCQMFWLLRPLRYCGWLCAGNDLTSGRLVYICSRFHFLGLVGLDGFVRSILLV